MLPRGIVPLQRRSARLTRLTLLAASGAEAAATGHATRPRRVVIGARRALTSALSARDTHRARALHYRVGHHSGCCSRTRRLCDHTNTDRTTPHIPSTLNDLRGADSLMNGQLSARNAGHASKSNRKIV